MISVKNSVLLFIVLACTKAYSQNESDTLLAKDNVMIPLPTVSVNFGFNHLMSDVLLQSEGPSPFQQFGYQLSITQRATKFMNVTLDLYTGTVYGEEQRNQTNLNFRTTLFSQHLNVEYNFYPLLKPDSKGRQLIRPYLGFGVGAIFFRSKGDLKNGAGQTYNYWSDGLIYAETEGTVAQSEATSLTRDFVYETDLRDANLDGLRKYAQTAFTLPLNAGIRFQITKNIGLNAAFAYSFNFSDMLDNVSESGSGDRVGASGNDNHLFGSIGLSVFLGTTKPSAKPQKQRFEEQLAKEDAENMAKPLDVEVKEDMAKWNRLESISNQLAEASESMQQVAAKSKETLEDQGQELTAIADRSLDSNKDLKAAKKESLEILDNSISTLTNTTSELNETVGQVRAVSVELNATEIEKQFSGTEKIRSTVEETIPAMEELKSRISGAKSEAELKSVLNISSRNLSHTQEIFSQESDQINESLVVMRKEVVEARTEELLGESDKSIEQIKSIKAELEELLADGAIPESEYRNLKSAIEKSESQLMVDETEQESDAISADSNLEITSTILKNVLKTVTEANNQTGEKLAERRNELNSIAEKSIKSKKDLKLAKEEALKVLQSTLADLNKANSSIQEVSKDLNEAKTRTNDQRLEGQISDSEQVSKVLKRSISLLEESKKEVKSSRNSEELSSVINAASTQLSKTKKFVEDESQSLITAIDQTRKDLITAEVESIVSINSESNNDSDSEELSSTGAKALQSQLDMLLVDGLINQGEFDEMKASIDSASPNAELSKSEGDVIEQASNNQTKDIQKSNDQALVESNSDQKTESLTNSDETSKSDSKSQAVIKTSKPTPTAEEIGNIPPKESGGFHWADVNQNGWISPDEVLHFIDLLFEGESERTVEDIQNLIDYYFDQE